MSRKRPKVRKHSEFKPDEPKEEPKEEEAKPEKGAKERPDVKESEAHIRLSITIFAIAGVAVGYISTMIAPIIGNIYMILAGIVLAWVAGKAVQAVLGRKELKWLLGNGMIIYLFVWLIAWIFFFNYLGLAS